MGRRVAGLAAERDARPQWVAPASDGPLSTGEPTTGGSRSNSIAARLDKAEARPHSFGIVEIVERRGDYDLHRHLGSDCEEGHRPAIGRDLSFHPARHPK